MSLSTLIDDDRGIARAGCAADGAEAGPRDRVRATILHDPGLARPDRWRGVPS